MILFLLQAPLHCSILQLAVECVCVSPKIKNLICLDILKNLPAASEALSLSPFFF